MSKWLREIFDSPNYEVAMIWIVILNALSIGAQIDYREALTVGGWLCVNLFFLFVFAVEAILKIMVFGVRVYFSHRWNVYDFAITVACAVQISVCYSVYLQQVGLGQLWHSYVSGDMIQIARLLRLGRLAHIFPEIGVLIQSFLKSLKALGWIAMGAFLVFFIAACIVTVFIGRRQFQKAHGDEDIQQVRERFSTIPLSMFALFEIMTLEGWTDYVRPLLSSSPFFVVFFLCFIFVSAFFLLNLVTAVVVDRTLAAQAEANKSEEKKRSEERSQLIDQMVQRIRNLNRGRELVTKDNLIDFARGDTVRSLLEKLGENESFLLTMFELLDHDSDGEVRLHNMQTLWIAYEQPLTTQNFLRFHVNMTRRMEYQASLTFTVLEALEKTSGKRLDLPKELFDKTKSFFSQGGKIQRPSERAMASPTRENTAPV